MEDTLIEEYLETRLYDFFHEKDDMPDRITLPSGEVLVRNGMKYTDRRGQVYSYSDVKNFMKNQRQRRSQNIENNKRWKYKPEDRYNDPDYVDDTAGTYGEKGLLRIGDIEYYENPNMAKVVDLMKKNNGVGFMVTNNNQILISPDKYFCEIGSVKLLQKYYRIEPEKVGIISMAPRGLIYSGIGGNLIIGKSLYKKQADNVRDAIKVLTKAYPFVKASPQTDNFFKWAHTAWRDWHAPVEAFEFLKWLKKGYSEEEYRGEPDTFVDKRKIRTQSPSPSYFPNKAGYSIEDELMNKGRYIKAPSDKDLEKTNKSISVEFTGEASKVKSIIDQAFKDNKINKQMKVKAEILLKKAVLDKNDKIIFQLKSLMLKALKG